MRIREHDGLAFWNPGNADIQKATNCEAEEKNEELNQEHESPWLSDPFFGDQGSDD